MTVRLQCVRCGAQPEVELGTGGCTRCASQGDRAGLATVYDLARARPAFAAALDGPLRGTGRYASLLPVTADELAAQDVGDTPLVELPRLAADLGVARLWLKDESRAPTWSFKDRAAVVAAAHARRLRRPALVVSSTGNAAAATAAHARRAGLPAVILFAKGVDPVMSAFVQAYGAHVVVTEAKADRWRLMRFCVTKLNCYPNSNYADPPIGNNPWAVDGYKGIGFEIWEQLGCRLPTAVLFPICYGDALFGVFKGFTELRGMGFVDHVPLLGGGEVYGSLERALHTGADAVGPGVIDHATAATSIASAQSTYQALHAVRATGGWVSQLSEGEMADAERLLAERVGLYVERAAAASLAALVRQRADGRIGPDAEVVLVSSSAGLKSIGQRLPPTEPQPVADVETFSAEVQRLL